MAHAAPDASTRYIHSELLCFVINKLDVLPFEVLVKTCTDFYSSDKIQEAKDLLWETVMSVSHGDRRDLRNIKRKNTGANSKARANCEDIVKAVQVCDKEGTDMPKFYAVDLGSVPLSPESVDITVLLSQFSLMHDEMKELKEGMKSLHAAMPNMNTVPQNSDRSWAAVAASQAAPAQQQKQQQMPAPLGPGLQQQQQMPAPLGPGLQQQQQRPAPLAPGLQQQQQRPAPLAPGLQQQQQMPAPLAPGLQQQQQMPAPLGPGLQQEQQQQQRPDPLAPGLQQQQQMPVPLALSQEPKWQKEQQRLPTVDSDGFTLVTGVRKKSYRKRIEVKGSGSSTLLKGVAPPQKMLDLFIGRLDLSTTSEAVELHVNWILQGNAKAAVSEITHCADTYGYRGFKVTVPAETVSMVLCPEKWPSHVSIKRYYRPKGGEEQGAKNLSGKGVKPKPDAGTKRIRSSSVGNAIVCL